MQLTVRIKHFIDFQALRERNRKMNLHLSFGKNKEMSKIGRTETLSVMPSWSQNYAELKVKTTLDWAGKYDLTNENLYVVTRTDMNGFPSEVTPVLFVH